MKTVHELLDIYNQVDEKIWDDYLSIYGVNLEKVDLSLPQKKFTSFFENEGVRYLDLLPDFKKKGRERRPPILSH